MQTNTVARVVALGARFVSSRRYVAIAAAIALALLGVGAVGAHTLKADTTSMAGTTATPSASSLPASNAGPKNIVQVKNFTSGATHVEGRVQLGRVPGDGIGAVNIASAFSSCTNCNTLAVALQINLFNRNANIITPQNAAAAVNAGCNNCDTIAYAVQYNIGVDDPTQVPPRVNQLIAQMKQELAHASAGNTSPADAVSEINAVIAQYGDLASFLTTRREEAVAPNSSPAGTSPSPTEQTPSPSSESTATPAQTPAASPSTSPAPASPSPSSSPSTTASAQASRLAT